MYPGSWWLTLDSTEMNTRTIACMIALVLAISCRKEGHTASTGADEKALRHRTGTDGLSDEERRLDRANPEREQERARQREFSKLLESARKSFETHDIQSALAALEEADGLYEARPDVLTLRGSCQVELRDFEKALADFSQALEKMPENASIHFNIGEVQFVTKRWDDAIQSFNRAKDRLVPESAALLQLINFKLMLCEAGRGNREAFEAKADANSKVQGTLLSEYTKVARAYHSQDDAAAKEALKAVSGLFSDAETRAPWDDALTEFGYIRREDDWRK